MSQELYDLLSRELSLLEQMAVALESRIHSAPNGSLRVHTPKGKNPQYYLYKKNEAGEHLDYIRKENRALAAALAQKSYDEQVLLYIYQKLNSVHELIDCYEMFDCNEIYDALLPARKELVKPIELSDEDFVREWKESKHTGENTYQKKGNYQTKQGEYVRSKSEIIIADKLYQAGVPYVYEPALYLAGGECLFPDFAVLNLRLRKEYYWEHFGIMDRPDYASRAIEKIDLYERNGLWPGKNLLLSFETGARVLDTRNLDNLILTFLK